MLRIDWILDFKVHDYDFLSAVDGKNGHRGAGYDAAIPHFRDFHVGMATQHGYDPCRGETQMKLARQVGSGVGLSNGWIEYTGLHRLPAPVKAKMIADIGSIV